MCVTRVVVQATQRNLLMLEWVGCNKDVCTGCLLLLFGCRRRRVCCSCDGVIIFMPVTVAPGAW